MRSSKTKWIAIVIMPLFVVLAVLAILLIQQNQNSTTLNLVDNREITNPHIPGAHHPQRVRQMIALLPDLPTIAPLEEIRKILELPSQCGGHVSSTTFVMNWGIAPGYAFTLSMCPRPRDDNKVEIFSAGFSAQNKSGFPPEEHHMIYPYRKIDGMASE